MLDTTSRLLIAAITVLGASVVSFLAFDGTRDDSGPQGAAPVAITTAGPAPDHDDSRAAAGAAGAPAPRGERRCVQLESGGQNREGAFIATIDGKPDQPLALCGIRGWDIQVHSRNNDTWLALEPMQAQHGSDCAGPPAAHANETYEGAVFLCRDHVMTAINAGGYGLIYLTPSQVLDFSAGAGTVSLDISTERMSIRDWWDIWITPYAENLAVPFTEGEVDLAGGPRNAVHLSIETGESAPILTTYVNGEEKQYNHGWDTPSTLEGIKPGTNQAAIRQPFKLTITRTHVRLEREASATGSAVVFIDQEIPALGWSQGIVQFGHHSYNPTKDNAGVPATWHWDNLAIRPAIPFTIIPAEQRYAEDERQPVTFAEAAPANAMLRFAAIGKVEVSFDGGAFKAAEKQFATKNGDHPEHFSSYWTPIPEGARSVRLRFRKDDWYEGPYFAADFSIWARP